MDFRFGQHGASPKGSSFFNGQNSDVEIRRLYRANEDNLVESLRKPMQRGSSPESRMDGVA